MCARYSSFATSSWATTRTGAPGGGYGVCNGRRLAPSPAGDPNHANSPARFAPLCERHRVVQPLISCCRLQELLLRERGTCIKLVSSQMVLRAALDLLHERPRSSDANGLLRPGMAASRDSLCRRGERLAKPSECCEVLPYGAGLHARRADRRSGFDGSCSAWLSSLLTLVSLPLAVRYLGAERFGVWATITSTVVFLNLLDLGIASTLTNHIASVSRRWRPARRRVLHDECAGA